MATITIEGKRLVIVGGAHERRSALQIPGSGPRQNGDVTLPLNAMSWYELVRTFSSDIHEYTEVARQWRHSESLSTDFGKDVNEGRLQAWDQADLWEWQAQALVRLKLGSALVAADRGMGKTRLMIEAIRDHWVGPESSAVVISRKRIRSVWSEAGGLWWRPDVVVSPSATTWSEAADQIGSAPITVLTYEALLNPDICNAIIQLNPEWLIVDEAHNVKKRSRQNQRVVENKTIKTATKSGALRKLPGAKRVALSGTPMPNDWTEVWTLLNFVAPEVFTSFWQFVEILGEVKVSFWGGKEISPEPIKMDLWDEIFDRWVIRAQRPEHGKVWDFVPVELSKIEKKSYEAMRKDARVELNGNSLEAKNPLDQAVKLQQMAGGAGRWVTTEADDGRVISKYYHAKPSAKVDLLVDMVEGLQRAVVFTRFRDRANFVSNELAAAGIDTMLFTGGTSEIETQRQLVQFKNTEMWPDDLVAVCVYGTVSEGINDFVSASDIFFLDWTTAKDVAQAADRLDRPGQTRLVRCVTLFARGTIDEAALDREAGKVKSLREVLRSPDGWRWLTDRPRVG